MFAHAGVKDSERRAAMSWEGEQAGQADTRGEAEQHRHGQRQEGPSQEAADTQKK